MELLEVFPQLAGVAVLRVTLFFIISGYLVTQSWTREPVGSTFLRKRFLRVYPALACCLLFSIVLGASQTSLAFEAYWQSAGVLEYFVRNMLLQNHLPLPGVFEGNPVKYVVNGSLWTIPVEISCYLGVLTLGVAGALINRSIAVGTLLFVLAAVAWWGEQLNLFNATVFPQALPTYYSAFVSGALFYQLRQRVRCSLPIASALLLSSLVLPEHRVIHFVQIGALSYFVVSLAVFLGRHWPQKEDSIDLSYGIYLYAFPIQQVLASSYPMDSGWANLVKTLPLCIACACVSWYGVERPARSTWFAGSRAKRALLLLPFKQSDIRASPPA